MLARTDWQETTISDSTKIIYFSPRFSGFQVGASYTPDGGFNGASFGEKDNDGDFENVFDIGANYTNKFDDFGISISALYQRGTDEPRNFVTRLTKAQEKANKGAGVPVEDLEVWFVGAKVDFAGFTIGADYRDSNDTHLTKAQTAAGDDGGSYWSAAIGYQQGPWGISAWYSEGETTYGNGEGPDVDETITRFGIGGRYAIAPGWQIRADYNYVEHENIGGGHESAPFNSSESQAFILTNMFNF